MEPTAALNFKWTNTKCKRIYISFSLFFEEAKSCCRKTFCRLDTSTQDNLAACGDESLLGTQLTILATFSGCALINSCNFSLIYCGYVSNSIGSGQQLLSVYAIGIYHQLKV
ncbi:hypothetical protein MLD38_028036 [Melastoma candidum]|uniref:Uncharacterized protein n=1 Tax=Melastoma candidum TaxID=119954 RepID=A0ACB9N0C4_9MYRT|nr:hypothetical protein MLD38_028036 [Melastoma candidum]